MKSYQWHSTCQTPRTTSYHLLFWAPFSYKRSPFSSFSNENTHLPYCLFLKMFTLSICFSFKRLYQQATTCNGRFTKDPQQLFTIIEAVFCRINPNAKLGFTFSAQPTRRVDDKTWQLSSEKLSISFEKASWTCCYLSSYLSSCHLACTPFYGLTC